MTGKPCDLIGDLVFITQHDRLGHDHYRNTKGYTYQSQANDQAGKGLLFAKGQPSGDEIAEITVKHPASLSILYRM
jgi:hypothetical protein